MICTIRGINAIIFNCFGVNEIKSSLTSVKPLKLIEFVLTIVKFLVFNNSSLLNCPWSMIIPFIDLLNSKAARKWHNSCNKVWEHNHIKRSIHFINKQINKNGIKIISFLRKKDTGIGDRRLFLWFWNPKVIFFILWGRNC